MEFWGVEVKSGEPLLVEPGEGMVLHLSQACLGEAKKDKANESVCMFVNIDGKKLVLGTLFPEKLPQQLFDLVFDRNFELTHNWKNGSVFFYGYRANNPFDETEDESDSDEELIPSRAANNEPFDFLGEKEREAKQQKTPAAEKGAEKATVKDSAAGKQKVKIVEPNKDVKPDEDEDSSDETDDPMSEDESDSEEDSESDSDDDEEVENGDEGDEEKPKKHPLLLKAEPSKKRPTESATKTPGPDKKAKVVTPQKTDVKKGSVHMATPHPSKQAGKTPANKSNQPTPKSEGSHSCKPCNRSFKSENALDSHNKAKHSAGK